MDRAKVEEAIAELAEAQGMTTKTIRVGDLSVILGLQTKTKDEDDVDETEPDADSDEEALDAAMLTPAPTESEAALKHLKVFEESARRTTISSARLGSRVTVTVANHSLGDELDHEILRCAVTRYNSERLMHKAIVKRLEVLDPLPEPRSLLEAITFDEALAMVAHIRGLK